MRDIVTHPNDDLLREHLLTDDRLTLAEMGFPGSVRILAAGRYHARLDVDGRIYQFNIQQSSPDGRELVGSIPDKEPLLSALAWHRAAEAMLAVRRGHAEAHLNKSLRKLKAKQDV